MTEAKNLLSRYRYLTVCNTSPVFRFESRPEKNSHTYTDDRCFFIKLVSPASSTFVGDQLWVGKRLGSHTLLYLQA